MIYNEYNLIKKMDLKLRNSAWFGEKYIQFITRLVDIGSHRKIKTMLEAKPANMLFSNIEIETINICNGKCSFCPMSVNANRLKPHRMEEWVFMKILNELESIAYQGTVGLYSNNEPLLDLDIVEKARLIKSKLPNSILYIYTNGKLLDMQIFVDLIKYVDHMIIDCYGKDFSLPDNIKKIYNELVIPNGYSSKVDVYVRLENEKLTNRAGTAPNRVPLKKSLKSPCAFPFEQIVVRSTGQISLCCNDALGKMIMGDLKENTLLEIWHSGKYEKLRKTMLDHRESLPLCKVCDSIIPKVVEY